ncbi:MAG: glutamate--tRNA ligase, partial [Methanobacteriota archaeon]
MDDKVRATARLYALQNAALHGGRADPKAVLAKVMSQHPEARREARALIPAIEALVAEIDALGPDAQRALLEKEAPQLLERKGGERERPVLPPLPGAEEGKVVMRLAPYPSGPLHIGNGRMAVLNDEYAKRHKAKLLLVFDDTIGSEEKIPVLEAYDLIREGLEWLGVKVHGAPIYKSDRIPLFYDWARKLLSLGLAYVCQCPAERLRANREQGLACDHRSQTPEEGLDGFEKMLSGAYTEGTAIVRLKTDMQDRNPAFRDRVLLRIAERAHPRPEIGTKYRVWPMLEFSWAVDDHLLGITHILRGKDLVIEDQMEAFIWTKMGLPKAHFGHFGMLRIAEMKLSKSKSLKEVRSGEFEGWHDPRTWSLQSLEKRGIRPEAVRDFILSFGLSQSDIEVPAENLYTENRKLVDREANRYFFVADPVAVQATGL